MSGQYNPGALPPPPPIPSHQPSPSSPSSPSTPGGTSTSRRVQALQPPSIHTAFPSVPHSTAHASQTPSSAVPRPSPYVTNVLSPLSAGSHQISSPMATRSATSFVTPYNPQEWNRNGPVGRGYVPHASPSGPPPARNTTGYEASLPSPPPPYTANAADNSASSSASTPFSGKSFPPTSFQSQRSNTPSNATAATTSPGSGVPSQFPPPPPTTGQRDRSTSRSRFNLSMLTSRNKQSANSPANTTSAMETLQHQTREAIARAPPPPPSAFNGQPYGFVDSPPAARRSTSTGYINSTSEPIRRSSTADSLSRGENRDSTVSIPPPPPGPPPSTSRSQSLNRSVTPPSGFESVPPRPTRRPTTSNLGPIPPTPADWVEDAMEARSKAPRLAASPAPGGASAQRGVRHQVDHAASPGPEGRVGADQGSLEDQAHMNIRERRNASRARSQSRGPGEVVPGDIAKPADLVLQSPNGGALSRKRVVKAKTSPLVNSHRSPLSSGRESHPDTPVWPQPVNGGSAFTPPITGGGERDTTADKYRVVSGRDVTTPMTPGLDALGSAKSSGSGRIVSPAPGEYGLRQTTSGNRPSSSTSNLSLSVSHEKNFSFEAQERHRQFLEKEAAATDDVERLELFAAFIVNESRLRRDRYAEAFESMGSDVLDLTRDLWRSQESGRRTKTLKTDMTPPPRGGGSEAAPSSASSASHATGYSPSTEPESPGQARSRSEARRQETFQPMLSPIPSMAMSTARDPDEQDSRGRAPSRWWEPSSGGASVGQARRVERSKRESKYMGVSKETLQWGIPETDSPGPSQQFHTYGPNEYPPEKVGWHEPADERLSQVETPRKPTTPHLDTFKMDISRLVTLPPPYPRHHPALNNNHPHLADIRATLRHITDDSKTTNLKATYEEARTATDSQADSASALAERRKSMRTSIQTKVASGEMSFAEAANAEADFERSETSRIHAMAQKDFENFQSRVLAPLNAHYTEQINKATNSIEQLRNSLADDARSHDPNQTQEEGDEQPELLEKITLLKWFFEAREQLYRRMFDLEQESDEKYRNVILTPYKLSNNQDKIHEVDSFFRKDNLDRKVKHENKAHARFEDFLKTVEKHATRGVQLQNSAFWDIAPLLLETVQKVPSDLKAFDVQIPASEYEDTPSYHTFPLQYLYSLLNHASKSAYQFIESQVNLSCLLHEVKTSVMKANCRQLALQRQMAGENVTGVETEMQALQKHEEESITRDLKEKVDIIEEQWRQALGNGLKDCMRRAERHLQSQGGWDESLME